jgi:hypothetical protein
VRPAPLAAGAGAVAAAVILTLTRQHFSDYATPTCTLDPLCDDPAPAIDALASGDVSGFFHAQRLMGPVSLLLRAPFVAVAGGDQLSRYRAGLLACMLALALLGALLAWIAARRGRPWWFVLLAGIGPVVNPATIAVLGWGHPEEILGGVLVAGAALALLRERPELAGLLAGLALANKLWALVAVPALLLAAGPVAWRRFAAVAVVTAGVLIGVTAVAAPGRFSDNVHAIGRLGSVAGTVSVTNAWFPLAHEAQAVVPAGYDTAGHVVHQQITGFALSPVLAKLARIAILLAALGAAALWWARRDGSGREGAILAIALALLMRCILDPGTYSYYHAPFVIVLAAYETVVARRVPWLSLTAATAIAGFTHFVPDIHDHDLLDALYLAWSVPLAAAMSLALARARPARAATGDL